MDKQAYFWQVMDGRLPPPRAAATLGMTFTRVDAEAGTIEAAFDGKPEFANPVGVIQGGFLAAMLDDLMGATLGSTLAAGEFSPTLNLNVSFVRPAKVGAIEGGARIVKRGKEVCFLAGELYQEGELLASASATAVIRRT